MQTPQIKRENQHTIRLFITSYWIDGGRFTKSLTS